MLRFLCSCDEIIALYKPAQGMIVNQDSLRLQRFPVFALFDSFSKKHNFLNKFEVSAIRNLLLRLGEQATQSASQVQATHAATRNGSVDLLRFFGAIGIIQFHCGAPGGWFGLSALPMFVALLVFFGAGKPISRSFKRLMVPWIFWCCVYAFLKICQSTLSGSPISEEFAPWMIFTGTSIHLWFLPFSFLFLVACRAIPERLPNIALYAGAIVLSAVTLWACNAYTLPIPLAQWFGVVPAACAGLLMKRTDQQILPPIVLAIATFGALSMGMDSMSGQLMIAGLAIALAFSIQIKQSKASDLLSGLAFGMYLVHPAMIAAALYVVPVDSPLLFPLVALASLVATLVLKKIVPASV